MGLHAKSPPRRFSLQANLGLANIRRELRRREELMKNASGWSYLVIRWLRFSRRWAWAATAVGLVAALTPAMTLAQTRAPVIESFNGSGLTLRAYINNILMQ